MAEYKFFLKIGEKNFGELLVIRQIRQSILPPTFSSVRYLNTTKEDSQMKHSFKSLFIGILDDYTLERKVSVDFLSRLT